MICKRAHAKLNLYLRVLGRRPDGYHELETLFERIDLADELRFEEQPRGLRLTCDDPTLPVDDDNLVLRAARILQETVRTSQGASIHLTKRIPVAAGLGGGSSDAASTLLGLNELWQLDLDQPTLVGLASRLGSDVPFFLAETAWALGTGRGERCEPVRGMERLDQVLVVPDARLSAKEVYEGLRAPARPPGPDGGAPPDPQTGLTARPPSITMVLHALSNGSLDELAKGLWNDLEPEAIRRCPISGQILSSLREHGCLGTRVSGSGPSVFGLCRDLAHAQQVTAGIRRFARPSWRIEIVQTTPPVRVNGPAEVLPRSRTGFAGDD